MNGELFQALIDALQPLYPEEIKEFQKLWKSDERSTFLLQLANKAAQDGYIGAGKDSLMVYKQVTEKRHGVTDAEAHTATLATSIDQTIKGSLSWSNDELQKKLTELMSDLQRQKREQQESARELWPSLLEKLEQAGLQPEEHIDTNDFRKSYVKYGPQEAPANLTFSRFADRLNLKSC